MSTFGFGSTAPTFGTAANTQSQAGTLFGASASTLNNSSAGTLFGANTSNNTSAAGTLFGGSAASTTSGFGGFNKPAAGGFGTPATSTAGTTSFSFGTPATSTAASTAPTNSFSFGAAAPATSTAGGFGAPATATSAAPTSTFSFGAQQQQQATPNIGFGATTGGFETTATTGTTGFGGFGTNTLTANKPATTTTFGGGFSSNTSLFGNKPQTTITGFGGFGQPQQQQQLQQQSVQVQEKVWQDLALIKAHFDPTSPLCYFRHYFYNMVPANEAHLYVRPPNQDEQLWNEAQRKNPDPKCLVPVLAIGFDDILKRMEIQSKQVELHEEKLKETTERLNTVQRQYALGTLVKLEEHKRRHIDLTQRLLRLLRHSQVLRHKGFPLNAQEEQSFNTLNQLATQPDNPENLHNKMLHLWSQLQVIKQQRALESNRSAEVWRSVREEETEAIAKILEDEQIGITHVANTLKADAKELDIIETNLRDRGNRMEV